MTVIEFPRSPRLSETVGRFRFDPLGFVQFAFPWRIQEKLALRKRRYL